MLKTYRLLFASTQYHLMRSAGFEIIRTITIYRIPFLYKISLYLHCPGRQIFRMVVPRIRRKASSHLHIVRFIHHLQICKYRTAIVLYSIIPFYFQLPSVYVHSTACLYQISLYLKLVSVQIYRSVHYF